LAVAVLWLHPVNADTTLFAEGAPPEVRHWEKLIGQWSTTEESFRADGSGWDPSTGADWSFHSAFDGWGIRDDYFSPPLGVKLDDETTRQRGINLRIYNVAEQKWIMTWLTTSSTVPATFTAISDAEEIVMLTDVANPQGFFGRITFFDMQPTSFEWKLEWSKDKTSWEKVYRIHATRKPQ
jgi:hypothetical protein